MHGDMLIQASELALAMMLTMLICLMQRNAAAIQCLESAGWHGGARNDSADRKRLQS